MVVGNKKRAFDVPATRFVRNINLAFPVATRQNVRSILDRVREEGKYRAGYSIRLVISAFSLALRRAGHRRHECPLAPPFKKRPVFKDAEYLLGCNAPQRGERRPFAPV